MSDISAEDVATGIDTIAAGIAMGSAAHPAVGLSAGALRLVAALVRALGVEDAEAAIRELAKSHGAGITDAELAADDAETFGRLGLSGEDP